MMYRYCERTASRTLEPDMRTVLTDYPVSKSLEGSNRFFTLAVGEHEKL